MRKAGVDVDCEYTLGLLKSCFAERKSDWSVTYCDGSSERESSDFGKADLVWGEYERVDWTSVLKGDLKTNNYCIRKGISRKAEMTLNVKKFISKRPESILCESFPESYVLQVDDPEYFDEALSEIPEIKYMNSKALLKSLQSDFAVKSGEDLKESETESDSDYGGGLDPTAELVLPEGVLERAKFLAKEREDRADSGAEGEDLKDEAETGKELWIAKCSMLNQGQGCWIFTSPEELEEIVTNSENDLDQMRYWVLQRYISPPLLVEGRKFHLRMYCLAVGNLQVWLYHDALALFASKSYSEDDEDLADPARHLSNTCLQMKLRGDDLSFVKEEDLVKRIGDVFTKGIREKVWQQTREIIHDLFECVHFEPASFQPLENCFELYGLDFLVRDGDYRVFFLEANPTPDFRMTGDALKDIPEGVIRETFKLAIDGKSKKYVDAEVSAESAKLGSVKDGKMWLCYNKHSCLGRSSLKLV